MGRVLIKNIGCLQTPEGSYSHKGSKQGENKKYINAEIAIEDGVIVEIKSGKDYKKHTALDKVRAVSEWKFGRSVVFCGGNAERGDVLYLPWYMVMFFRPQKAPESMIYEVDISGLVQ